MSNDKISITWCFGKNKSNIFVFDLTDITMEWIMQNLPPNVLSLDYHRMSTKIYPLDKLPKNLDLLIITELTGASNLENLPANLTKLNLYNCRHVRYNLKKLPQSLKLLILPEDYCDAIRSYEQSRTYYSYEISDCLDNIETVCYGRLKMQGNKFCHFLGNHYNKYNSAYDNSSNILDAFLSELLFKRKKFFEKNYEYSEDGWYHLAMTSGDTYVIS
jgi:hypothetical protein